MRNIWIKVFLLILYPIFLTILLNLLACIPWIQFLKTFDTSLEVLDPVTIKNAKQILDSRGISYSGVVEKEELIRLIEISGTPTKEELADHISIAKVSAKTVVFTSPLHFLEEVRKTEYNPWLVQIVSNDLDKPFLPVPIWNTVLSKVSEFGIKAGRLSCDLYPKLCIEKEWRSSRLVLALPQANQTSKDVVFYDFQLTPTTDLVLQWIRHHLVSQVKQIRSIQRLQNWMTFSDSDRTNIRVILFSTQAICPMFFSALAIKFHDRIPFAVVDVTDDIKTFVSKSKFPLYLVISPEDTYVYGSRKGEAFNFKSMEIFLNSFLPKINDIWLWSLLLTNALAIFELFFINIERKMFLQQLLIFIVTAIKYNCCLFIFWVVYVIMHDAPIVEDCTDILLKFFRLFNGSYIASLIRSDYKHFYSYPFNTITFALFATIAGFLLNKYNLLEEDSSRDVLRDYFPFLFGDWWKELGTTTYFRASCASPTRNASPTRYTSPTRYASPIPEQEENFESTPRSHPIFLDEFITLLELLRNTHPDLMRQSVVSVDCIEDFPQWKYQDSCSDDTDKNDNLGQTPKEMKEMIDLQKCSICQESYSHGQNLCGLPCGHNYHVNCITVWLTEYNDCCPLCRFKIVKHNE